MLRKGASKSASEEIMPIYWATMLQAVMLSPDINLVFMPAL